MCPWLALMATNRPFPSSPGPLFQNEGRGSAFDMEIIFLSHENKTHFHKKGCAPSLILKVRAFGIRKWPIGLESLMLSVNLGLIGFEIWDCKARFKIPIGGFLPCSERFFLGFSGFHLSSKANTSKFQFDLERTETYQQVINIPTVFVLSKLQSMAKLLSVLHSPLGLSLSLNAITQRPGHCLKTLPFDTDSKVKY